MSFDSQVRSAILSVVDLLVQREYVLLANITGNSRFSAEMLERAVSDYGRTLIMPPSGGLPPDLDVTFEDAHPERLHAVMSLWTEEDGQSDLSLKLTLTVRRSNLIDTEIDDLQVMHGGQTRTTAPGTVKRLAIPVSAPPGRLRQTLEPIPRFEHDLTQAELAAIRDAVLALVEHDHVRLLDMGAFNRGADPYMWTKDYGPWPEVHLRLPPGDPREWDLDVYRDDDHPREASVDLTMWTEEEGRSDLTLQLELATDDAGHTSARIRDLHVM
jgi:hypothetical protein